MEIPVPIRDILLRLRRAGFGAYAVGGCVRDALLGLEPHDWDVCTAATPGEVEAVFPDCRCLETGLRHGTVTLLWEGRPVEVTTFRTDGEYRDGRRPESVRFTLSLEEDLARRDFTCNAMAWGDAGELIDPFGGRADLEAGILRCVGKPEQRFREDALRLLRALRFAARYGFTIEPRTAAVLHTEAAGLCRIAPERCFTELRGLLEGRHAPAVLREFGDVLFPLLPELSPVGGQGESARALNLRAMEHTAEVLERMALLLRGCPAESMLRRFRCDNATREAVVQLVSLCDSPPPATLPQQRRELARLGVERSGQLARLRLALARASGAGEEQAEAAVALREAVLREGGCLTLRQLAVHGGDLLALGAAPGPALGALLGRLLEAVLDGDVPNEREALLALARTWLGGVQAP